MLNHADELVILAARRAHETKLLTHSQHRWIVSPHIADHPLDAFFCGIGEDARHQIIADPLSLHIGTNDHRKFGITTIGVCEEMSYADHLPCRDRFSPWASMRTREKCGKPHLFVIA